MFRHHSTFKGITSFVKYKKAFVRNKYSDISKKGTKDNCVGTSSKNYTKHYLAVAGT